MPLTPVLAAILAFAAPSKSERVHADADTLASVTFETDCDLDYDLWPDGWSRQRGRGFPHFIPIAITDAASAAGNRCLEFRLDGGAALAKSPPVKIDDRHDYLFEVDVQTQGLTFDDAFISVIFLDADERELARAVGEHVGGDTPWKTVRIGPTVAPSTALYAVIALSVEPRERPGLTGTARFDNVWAGRVPRMDLELVPGGAYLSAGRSVRAICRTSGTAVAERDVEFEVTDGLGRVLASERKQLAPNPEDSGHAAQWNVPLEGAGYYRVRARMMGSAGPVHMRERTVVLLPRGNAGFKGEFGWTLEDAERSLSLAELANIASEAGIHWLKFPLWYGDEDASRVDRLMWFSDRLNSQGIEIVGLLHEPPTAIRQNLAIEGRLTAAAVFSQDPQVWYPPLETVMARLSLKVRWWQLGQETDTSFTGYPSLVEKLTLVKQQFDLIGQGANLGIGWSWLESDPEASNPPWRFLARSSEPLLSSDELGAYLDAAPPAAQGRGRVRQWVSIEPVPVDRYTSQARTADLVQRLVAAKAHGADAIFFRNPIGGSAGLVHEDGTPGELFLPWRTTALALTGGRYLGALDLPDGARGEFFAKGTDTIMVLSSPVPVTETVYLGENVRQHDCWGKPLPVEETPQGQRLSAGPLPTFVTGVNRAVAAWRLDFRFSSEQLASSFGVPLANGFRLTNVLDHGAGVRVRIVPPAGWKVTPESLDLRLAAGETAEPALAFILPSRANSGPQTVRVDVAIQGDRPVEFSLFRTLEVGSPDLRLEAASYLNEEGELEVEQRLINRSAEIVNFRCYLSAPNRRRLRSQALGVAHGENVQTYRLADGKSLVGQPLSVRAEEIEGDRVLNYTFVAQP